MNSERNERLKSEGGGDMYFEGSPDYKGESKKKNPRMIILKLFLHIFTILLCIYR